MQMQSPLRGL